jgi:hypothetical protein
VSLDFSMTYSFRPYHGPGVDSAPSENEYQEHFLGVEVAGGWGWQPHHLQVPNVMKSGSLNLLEPSGPHPVCYGTALPLPLLLQILRQYMFIDCSSFVGFFRCKDLSVISYPIMLFLLYMVARRGLLGTFCWCIRNRVTVRKMHGKKHFRILLLVYSHLWPEGIWDLSVPVFSMLAEDGRLNEELSNLHTAIVYMSASLVKLWWQKQEGGWTCSSHRTRNFGNFFFFGW